MRFTNLARSLNGSTSVATKYLFCILALCLQACGGGAETEALPDTRPPEVVSYQGPASASDDVQRFRLNVWENLKANTRCGGCHIEGKQSPEFVRQDDVNLAYNAVNGFVNLTSPSESKMVVKVGGGHHCWLESNEACATILEAYIKTWANGASDSTAKIELKAPTVRDAGASKNFPADSTLFAQDIYPLLTEYCSSCHAASGKTPQSPYFASSDIATAYAAIKTKIDLDTPSRSRIVLRLRNESHNCWSDCAANSAELETAISTMANQISAAAIDPSLVLSKALRLTDGIPANGGGRNNASVIALYEFKTGKGAIAYDTSGISPAVDLSLSGDFSWVGGWGVQIIKGKAQGTTKASKKLYDMIKATGEYSIEAWVAPGNVTQNDSARIVSYSGGSSARNFTLGQSLYNYDFLNRTNLTDKNGGPALSTADADERLQATLQHVVVTFDPTNGRRIYVNGEYTNDADETASKGGSLADWDDSFALVLGNEVSSDHLWQGVVRMVAIHNRALSADQIQKNFAVGVGEKFYLLFNVSALVPVPKSYIVVEMSQFDSYSYLIYRPFFISLDSTATITTSIPITGMRIGVNGKEVDVGQAYRNLATAITTDDYVAGEGQVLSNIGTIVALEKGPEADEFFLTFEKLGDHDNVVLDPVPVSVVAVDGDPQPDVGLRTFDEINASMAAVTGVDPNTLNVAKRFGTVKQQLPTVPSVEGFISAQQMAVTQLAIEYCNALVSDTTLRASYFPGFNFSAAASSAFSVGGRSIIVDSLVNHMLGAGVASQPDASSIGTELNSLIDRLTSCAAGCASNRTEQVVKASCGAVLGSAVTLLK